MAFLENIGKRVGEAAQAAAKKSGELVEVTKLNVQIGQEEDKIERLYAQIGKSIYKAFAVGEETDSSVAVVCEQIKTVEININSLRDKISEIKNVKTCANCGAEMERTQMFCSKCGERSQPAPQPEAEDVPSPEPVSCPNCGTTLPAEAEFCTNCGNKL